MLLVVRHAAPLVDPAVAARDWSLSPAGQEAASQLAAALPANGYLVASTEPKASGTIAGAGPVRQDAAFDEVARDEPFDENYRIRRAGYVAGDTRAGWEPRAAVAARFTAGITRHRRAAGAVPLIVASHGMAITVWLTFTIGLDYPGEFWRRLGFPDALRVDTDRGAIERFRWED